MQFRRAIEYWGWFGAAALAVIVLAHSVHWFIREITLWQDFRRPQTPPRAST